MGDAFTRLRQARQPTGSLHRQPAGPTSNRHLLSTRQQTLWLPSKWHRVMSHTAVRGALPPQGKAAHKQVTGSLQDPPLPGTSAQTRCPPPG